MLARWAAKSRAWKRPAAFEKALVSAARQNFNLHEGLGEDSRAFAAGILGTSFHVKDLLTASSKENEGVVAGIRSTYESKALAAAAMAKYYTNNVAVRDSMRRVMQKMARRVMASPQMMSAVCGTDKVICMKKFTEVANVRFFKGIANKNTLISVVMLTAEACAEIRNWLYGRQSGELTIVKVSVPHQTICSANLAKRFAAAGLMPMAGARIGCG